MAQNNLKGLVIVESPTKVKKIGGFLSKDYKVMACVGHVRDLPANSTEVPADVKKESWASLGVNVDKDFEPLYVVPKAKKKVIKDLKDAAKNAAELIIATDEDREGESIGWHLVEILNPKVPVKRMVFSEITKEAIQEAIQNPREINQNLVNAQETRRVLDRLFGYTLSPLLWKKVARGLSAGRVQSVATRLLVLRELERMAFKSGQYWDLKAELATEKDERFTAKLNKLKGTKVASGKDFDESTGKLKKDAKVLLLSEEDAVSLRDKIVGQPWVVSKIEERKQTRKPYAPFTTSSLQQESNRKLGFTARQTMQIAQGLYENGHITYMRTDSTNLSKEALSATRKRVEEKYGKEYLSPEPRQFTKKSKGAQEAHEAIRPAGGEMKTSEELGLSGPGHKLYSLIWKRTMATQMAEAKLRFQTVTISVDDAEFRAVGKRVDFPGFFRAYVEGVDDPEAALDDQEENLPHLEEKQSVDCKDLESLVHETKPPARYTEATLVKGLEEDGIGRPSTYASIIGTIQDRGYVVKVGTQLVPTFTAIAVNQLLERNFSRLVDFSFTAEMEKYLDDIASGDRDRLQYLQDFYSGAEGLAEQVKTKEASIDARETCTLKLAGLDTDIRVGRYGPFFEKEEAGEKITASIPPNIAPADLDNDMIEKLLYEKKQGPTSLGEHPETSLPVYVLRGPFGPYVQMGDVTEENKKPKRTSIPKNREPESVDMEIAIALLGLPKKLGEHPETGKVVNAAIGRYGPYVTHNGVFKSLGKDYDVLTVDLDTAVELLKQAKSRATATPIKELGKHPDDEQLVAIYDGRYGPYVKHGKINATIPKGYEIDQVSLEEAVQWVNDKAAQKGGKKKVAKKKKAAKKKRKKE